MLSNIEYSKPYLIQLLPLYGAVKKNCFVIGVTNIDNVANNQDEYNIYETYFAPYGYGLGSYYAAIIQSTKIYICNEISSLEPLSVDTSKKIFIPETLIDMENSHEYVECTNINFSIYPVIKRFNSTDDQILYLDEIKTKIKKKLGELIDFSILGNEVETNTSVMYLTKEEIDDIEEKRSVMFNENIAHQKSINSFNTEKNKQFDKRMSEMKKAIDEYTKKTNELEATKIKMEDTIKAYENLIKDLNNP